MTYPTAQGTVATLLNDDRSLAEAAQSALARSCCHGRVRVVDDGRARAERAPDRRGRMLAASDR
jgi:hypothetical protein